MAGCACYPGTSAKSEGAASFWASALRRSFSTSMSSVSAPAQLRTDDGGGDQAGQVFEIPVAGAVRGVPRHRRSVAAGPRRAGAGACSLCINRLVFSVSNPFLCMWYLYIHRCSVDVSVCSISIIAVRAQSMGVHRLG